MSPHMERLSRRVIMADEWLTHSVDTVRLPNGKVLETYHMIEFPGESVGVVLEDKEGRVLLVKALRYPTQSAEWELPAGSVEVGESAIEAIKREVFEETGYVIGSCALLCRFQPMNDLTSKVVTLFSAKLEGGVGRADDNEVVEARWFDTTDLKNMVANNEILDGLTMIGLLRWWWENTWQSKEAE